jgi:nicotinamidase-related amidase
MLRVKDSLVLIIDIQEKLVKACKDFETITSKTTALATAATLLSIPIVVTEQYPQGLGSTVEQLKSAIGDADFVEKTNFSALKEPNFKEILKKYNKKQILLCGIETHICVYQTCMELLTEGYEVYIVKDCCSSRNEFEENTGFELMKSEGAKLTCVEISLFEWLESSKHPQFKDIQKLIK